MVSAYTPTPAPSPRWRTLFGEPAAPRSVLDSSQDNYVVMDLDSNSKYAVVATDPARAAALARPAKFAV
jgi:hypothetical protein